MSSRVKITELSQSASTRERGGEAVEALQRYLLGGGVEIDLDCDVPITTSFLDEIVSRLAASRQLSRVKFLSTDQRMLEKLARLEGIRRVRVAVSFLGGNEDGKRDAFEGDPSRWNEITDPKRLWELVDREFYKTVGGKRYLRITMTPRDLSANRINTADQSLRLMIWWPTVGQRPEGWNVRVGGNNNQIVADALGLRSEHLTLNETDIPFIRLMRSGHLEFWVPIGTLTLCWNQPENEFQIRPRLWPTAVCEYPVSFLRFAKELYRRLDIDSQLIWRMEYRNLRGCALLPYSPGGVVFEPPHIFEYDHFSPRERTLEADFVADQSALEMLCDFYQAFGYESKHIPFFAEGKFNPSAFGY